MASKKKCKVFIPDPTDYSMEIECGKPAVGHATVKLPGGKVNANVDVCLQHKALINSTAAQLRVGSKVSR